MTLEEINSEHKHSRTYRPLKLALLREFGKCHWCKKVVRDVIAAPGECPPHDQATVDHLISRFYRKKGEEVLKVLACFQCNQQRSRAETQAIVKIAKGIPPGTLAYAEAKERIKTFNRVAYKHYLLHGKI